MDASWMNATCRCGSSLLISLVSAVEGQMRRREFITLLGGAAASSSWYLAAPAQERMGRIGVLMGVAESDPEGQARISALRQGLAELGRHEGKNLRIEYRWAGGDMDRIAAYAKELAGLAPDLIIGNGTPVLA